MVAVKVLLFFVLILVSRKRKKKNWEDEDYYDSDDDTFLDRTGTVEKKRQERMKKAGKIEERPETYESLVRNLPLYSHYWENHVNFFSSSSVLEVYYFLMLYVTFFISSQGKFDSLSNHIPVKGLVSIDE